MSSLASHNIFGTTLIIALTILGTTLTVGITQYLWNEYNSYARIKQQERERQTSVTILGTIGIILITQHLWKEYKSYSRHRQWQRDAQTTNRGRDPKVRAKTALYGQ